MKCAYNGKDFLFMILVVFKHGGNWDFLGRLFRIKGPTFERMIIKFLKLFSDFVFDELVEKVSEFWSMERCKEEGKLFRNFPYARYATDATFQQTNRPSGTMHEGKVYCSGKHKLYAYKFEVSVLSNGLAVGCSKHYPGSVADIDILSKNLAFHKSVTWKTEPEKEEDDGGLLNEEYGDAWAVLVEKGYQGAGEMMMALHPFKKPAYRMLSSGKTRFNDKLASDGVLVEN